MFKLPSVTSTVTRGCMSPVRTTCTRLTTTIERLWRAARIGATVGHIKSPIDALQRQLEPHIRAHTSRFLYTEPSSSIGGSTEDAPGKGRQPARPVSVLDLKKKYDRKQPIKMVTAYDMFSAKSAEAAGMDMLLVGDSLGMVVLGRPDTVSVTVDEIIHHCKAVTTGATIPLIVGDMPFGSYITESDAKANAIRLLKEGGAANSLPFHILHSGYSYCYVATISAISNGTHDYDQFKFFLLPSLCLCSMNILARARHEYRFPASVHVGIRLVINTCVQYQWHSDVTVHFVGVDIVKLEGGKKLAPMVQAITDVGIGVVGHIGLTPQTAVVMGGFCCQGKTVDAAMALVEDAQALQAAGCMAIVLECVPEYVGKRITDLLDIPTIGIGAGQYTSGQVLVFHDIIGLYENTPRLARQFLPGGELITNAIKAYGDAVETRQFPEEKHTFKMLRGERTKFTQMFNDHYGAPVPLLAPMYHTPASTQKLPMVRVVDQPIRNVCVVGGGALGSFVAAKLASLHDVHVTLVSNWRDDAMQRDINHHGLYISSHVTGASIKSAEAANVTAVRSADDIAPGSVDVVIVTTKAMDCAKAIASCTILCNPHNGAILTLNNGLPSDVPTLDTMGIPVLPGVVTHGAKLQSYEQVVQTGTCIPGLYQGQPAELLCVIVYVSLFFGRRIYRINPLKDCGNIFFCAKTIHFVSYVLS